MSIQSRLLRNINAQNAKMANKPPKQNQFDIAAKLTPVINANEHVVLEQVRAGTNPAHILATVVPPPGAQIPEIEVRTDELPAPAEGASTASSASTAASVTPSEPAEPLATASPVAATPVASAAVQSAPVPAASVAQAVATPEPAVSLSQPPSPAAVPSAPEPAVSLSQPPSPAAVPSAPVPAASVAQAVATPEPAVSPSETSAALVTANVNSASTGSRTRKQYVMENFYAAETLLGTGTVNVPMGEVVDRLTFSTFARELESLDPIIQEFTNRGTGLNRSELTRVALALLVDTMSTSPEVVLQYLTKLPRLPRGRPKAVRTLVES